MYQVPREQFEELVDDALDAIPERFAREMTNVVVLVRDYNEDEPTLLGLYEGVPLTERTATHTGYLPDTISIYQDGIERVCSSLDELTREVKTTVWHEVGHYFGFDDDELHELGWG